MSKTTSRGRVVGWIDYRLPIFSFLQHELRDYPAPKNLNYLWNFGSIAGIALVIMIVTGIALAMHYTPTVVGAFNSVEHIMRDVNYGWLIRYVHTTGASMFFAAVYIHIFRGLYYCVLLSAFSCHPAGRWIVRATTTASDRSRVAHGRVDGRSRGSHMKALWPDPLCVGLSHQ